MQVEETAAAANPGATYPFSGAAGQALFFDGSTSLFLSPLSPTIKFDLSKMEPKKTLKRIKNICFSLYWVSFQISLADR